ncbi:hypothetical protein ABPG72_021002 [Tetrahymena utriculariae]
MKNYLINYQFILPSFPLASFQILQLRVLQSKKVLRIYINQKKKKQLINQKIKNSIKDYKQSLSSSIKKIYSYNFTIFSPSGLINKITISQEQNFIQINQNKRPRISKRYFKSKKISLDRQIIKNIYIEVLFSIFSQVEIKKNQYQNINNQNLLLTINCFF